MSEAISRREFVRLSVVVAAGAAVAVAAGCSPTEDESATAVETPSTHLNGGPDMSGRILVGYATRTGSTVGVAEAIGRTLAERGFEVDVRPVREHPSLEGYDAAVVGSAINGGAWLPEALSFVQANAKALSQLPFAAFCVHSMNGGADEKQTKRRTAYLDSVRRVVNPVDEGFFLGKGPDAEDTSLVMRWAFKAFGGSGEGDMRDWNKIGAWANQVNVVD